MKAGGLAKVVEHLPSKQKALSKNPNTTKKKKKLNVKHEKKIPFRNFMSSDT
jgi:hypothetical protein